jgi:thioredoxin 1
MSEPTRAEVDALTGPTLLEFGSSWCGFCRAAQADIAAAVRKHPGLRHLKIEDGKGRPLGRSFGVKLWPTLIFLESGVEKARVVRPGSEADIDAILAS